MREGVGGLFRTASAVAVARIVSGSVVKPWHHRREAEGGRIMGLSSLVVSKPGLHRRRVERGPIATGTNRRAASRNYDGVGAECRIHHKDVGKDESGRKDLPAAITACHFFNTNEVTQAASIANRQSPANQSPYWT